MKLINVHLIWLLFVVVFGLLPVCFWCFLRKRSMLRTFAESNLLIRISPSVSISRQIIKACLLLISFVFIVIAVTRPVTNPRSREIKRKGRDIVILLDVSHSMLAEDIRPNRLERAKIAIGDLLDVLEGDRIGLVTFAGSSSIKCPLTQDYAFMRLALTDVTTESTARGGTMIGDAIRKAAREVFDPELDKHKDIILITDGEDHESFPVKAAQRVAEQGVRIIAIGLGDPKTGARIPIKGPNGSKTFMKDKTGQEVWTKLDTATLRQVAFATEDGKFLPVETGIFNLDEVYRDIVATAERRELESATAMQYDELFQWFLAAAVVMMLCEAFLSERKTGRK